VSRYGIENLPYGVFSGDDGTRRIGVRLGSAVVDLSPIGGVLAAGSLNPLLAAGRPAWSEARAQVAAYAPAAPAIPLDQVTLHLPFEVADYTDFYSSEQHALNAGRILRPQSPGLSPSWRRLPIGYHGRSATVVVSGTPVERPSGQLADGVFGPSRRLDIEAEVGFVVGVPGRRVPTTAFADHVFGIVLLNDWSARDIQAFEYRPLGPFLGKSFATSISPWVVPLDALAPIPPVAQDPVPHDYLMPPGPAFDLRLTVDWNDTRVSAPPFAGMYWTAAQQLAHLTSNGARLRTGDLFASGTVSGPGRDTVGSLIEYTSNGEHPLKLENGDRAFLEDGDEVSITATAPGPGGTRIGFGEVVGRILPATG